VATRYSSALCPRCSVSLANGKAAKTCSALSYPRQHLIRTSLSLQAVQQLQRLPGAQRSHLQALLATRARLRIGSSPQPASASSSIPIPSWPSPAGSPAWHPSPRSIGSNLRAHRHPAPRGSICCMAIRNLLPASPNALPADAFNRALRLPSFRALSASPLNHPKPGSANHPPASAAADGSPPCAASTPNHPPDPARAWLRLRRPLHQVIEAVQRQIDDGVGANTQILLQRRNKAAPIALSAYCRAAPKAKRCNYPCVGKNPCRQRRIRAQQLNHTPICGSPAASRTTPPQIR
jgi:hypothetical protein